MRIAAKDMVIASCQVAQVASGASLMIYFLHYDHLFLDSELPTLKKRH